VNKIDGEQLKEEEARRENTRSADQQGSVADALEGESVLTRRRHSANVPQCCWLHHHLGHRGLERVDRRTHPRGQSLE
jgi:hypothetical protein